MSELLSLINYAAPVWWRWMLHSSWQGIVVLMIVCAIFAVWRRTTPLWRYCLLLVVLLKFALPPISPVGFGLFNWLGQPPQKQTSVNTPQQKTPHLSGGVAAGMSFVQERLVL